MAQPGFHGYGYGSGKTPGQHAALVSSPDERTSSTTRRASLEAVTQSSVVGKGGGPSMGQAGPGQAGSREAHRVAEHALRFGGPWRLRQGDGQQVQEPAPRPGLHRQRFRSSLHRPGDLRRCRGRAWSGQPAGARAGASPTPSRRRPPWAPWTAAPSLERPGLALLAQQT